MNRYYLSLGSNIEPNIHMPACIETLRQHFRILNISSFYETEPVGPAGTDAFWNGVVEIETPLEKEMLVSSIREIEEKLGRKRDLQNKFKPRTIDIDILPQPDYGVLSFIIVPLAEIAPTEMAKEYGKTYLELASESLKTGQKIRKISFPA